MFINKITIKNYKCFENEVIENFSIPNGERGSGLNVLIGENNTGKTALISIFTKLKQNSMISDEEKNAGKDVEITINDSDGKNIIIKNIPGGSHINIDEQSDSGLKNENIDVIKDNRVWTSNFTGELPYQSYNANSVFLRSAVDSNLSKTLSYIEKNEPEKKKRFNELLKNIIPSFSEWVIRNSSKQGSYISYKLVNGNSLDIDFSLGSGILNIFRIILSFVEDKQIIFIDEPEAFLHPLAQDKLLNLLLDESKKRQIFISTHSPYMFKGAIGNGAKLWIFKREDEQLKIMDARDGGWGLFGRFSPTWGEVNWFAYDLPTVEFHNELFGYLEANHQSKLNSLKKKKKWLDDRKITGEETEEEKQQLKYDISLQGYIRHSIHHPGNIENDKYLGSELRESTQEMIKLLNSST